MGCHGGGLRGFATVGGLKWHAMRVGRPLRSTEGVGVELQRVAGWHRVAGSRNRGVTESQRIAHASRLAVTTGEAWFYASCRTSLLQNCPPLFLFLRERCCFVRTASLTHHRPNAAPPKTVRRYWLRVSADLHPSRPGINNNFSRQQQFLFSTIPPQFLPHNNLIIAYTVHVSTDHRSNRV